MTFPPSLSIVTVENLSVRTPPISRDVPQELLETNIFSEVMLELKKQKKKKKNGCGSGKSNAVIPNYEHFQLIEKNKTQTFFLIHPRPPSPMQL